MEARELRIGNWVKLECIAPEAEGLDALDYHKVNPYNILSLFDKSKDWKFEPIELTPEILTKAGFSLMPQRQSIYLRGRIKLWMGHNGCIAYLKHEDRDESYYIPNPCKYLHQLQNLYFALTGQELEINLNANL